MNVETTRFGMVEIDEDRIITVPSGLLGFAAYKHYALLQPDQDSAFFWLQSTEAPELAFVVTDPSLWVPDYQVPIRREQMDQLALDKLENAQVFVIVNKYDRSLTANMQGPLVVNATNRQGMQLVLADKQWTPRHAIVQLQEAAKVATA